MHFIIFLIIVIVLWLIFGQQIKRWISRLIANRTEDYIRKATGMPPRPDSREGRRQRKEAEARAYTQQRQQQQRQRRSTYRRNPDEPLIPKEYAEDVEFTETISYSNTTIGATDSAGRQTVYHESQVTDVEWVDIKIDNKRR